MDLRTLTFFALLAAAARLPAAENNRIDLRALDERGGVLASSSASGETAAATLKLNRTYQPGDRIVVEGPRNLAIRLDSDMPEHLVYCPSGRFEFAIPGGAAAGAYSPKYFTGQVHSISVRTVKATELAAYRNLALNLYDTLHGEGLFPHASASNYYRQSDNHPLPEFEPRNAIDGETKNAGHGRWPLQSWGPEKRSDLWWKLDFGREVELDKLVLYLRADFTPFTRTDHDDVWQSAVAEFSDGGKVPLAFKRTADKQEFKFPARKVTWLKLTNLVPPQADKWPAITELEAWGKDTAAK